MRLHSQYVRHENNKEEIIVKKILTLGLAVATMASMLTGCNLFRRDIGKIALVTDVGSIDDRSFNQGTWEGLVAFAEERNLVENEDYKYFVPAGGETAGTQDYVNAIELAIEWGAQTVITPGFLFEEAIYIVQAEYPDVKFILLDGEPHNADYSVYETKDNTLPILFQEEQSGFLAGYGAVKEGLDVPAFIGGMAVPAVVKFGIGFVAGAYHAAKEDNLTTFEFLPDNYWYSGVFWPDDAVVTRSASMYQTADVIFVAAGGAGSSVITSTTNAHTTANPKWMIGVDIDQGSQSPRILTSAMKGLGSAVIIALESIEKDEFEGGETLRLGASNDGVGLPTATASWRFTNFTSAEYNAILGKLADGSIVVPTDFATLQTYVNGKGLPFNFTANTITGASAAS
jgi:basic membrane protein A